MRTIRETVQLVRTGKVEATRLVKNALKRTESEADLNAFTLLNAKAAIARAARIDAEIATGESLGPLAGIPVVIKDNMNVAGLDTTAGTPGIRYQPDQSALVVKRLIEADAIVLGKTNLHELAFGVTSINAAFGAVRNAADPRCFAGGSSGGTATAVAADLCLAGLGSDTAGSVRLPAALCGAVGYRPTTWSVSPDGVVPSVPTFDVVGPITRCVEDAAMIYSIMTNSLVPEPRPVSELRIGLASPYILDLEPNVQRAFDNAMDRLNRAGVTIVNVDLAAISENSFGIGFPIGFYEMRRALTRFLQSMQTQASLETVVDRVASEDVRSVYLDSVLGSGAPSQRAYDEAIARIPMLRTRYREILEAHRLDAIAFPTSPLQA
ncbi:MAG: amidase family protein [Pseudomonadota bacterium]